MIMFCSEMIRLSRSKVVPILCADFPCTLLSSWLIMP